jgi:hypothetical protein
MKFLDAVDGMLADALKHMAQVSRRIDSVEKAGPDQASQKRVSAVQRTRV